jgi:ribosomal protein S18 acetylase RimI-like enzyme
VVIAIRAAESGDVERIIGIIHGDPTPEAVAVAGSPELARRFGAGLVRLDGIPNDDRPTVVALDGEQVVGVLQYRIGGNPSTFTLDHVKLAVSVFGLAGSLRRLPRFRGRSLVDIPVPANSLYVAELHVDPQRRGHGIGGKLLVWAIDEADRLGVSQLSLDTTTTNPARRLYERHGFVVSRTRLDRRYERFTGVPGRVLMERPGPPSPTARRSGRGGDRSRRP